MEMLRGLVATVPSEPGNISYEVYQTVEDRLVFYITERWSSSDDADRHVRSVATDPNLERTAALLAIPLDTVTLFRVQPLS